MHLNDEPLSFYDLLELTPDATPQEIRSAYLRLKSSYNKDNMAHYTLFSREETEDMLQKIEQAYVILSNPEKRRSYDQGAGIEASQSSEPLASSVMSTASITAATVARPEMGDADLFIQNEQEWTGSAIRRAREARRMTLDDLADYTRISKIYLRAIEEDDFARLPAIVYVRGFLQQLSKLLKLPSDLVTQKYLNRLKLARPDK